MKREIPHPDYNDSTTDSDWMLVVLERGTALNVPFVKINSVGSTPDVGDEVTVMGWGDTTADDATQKLSDALMSVDVHVISNRDCDDSSGSINGWSDNYHGQISENMMCARDDGQDSCQGDSGGPLIMQGADASSDVQIGVVSWGVGCASRDFPGVYSRVSRAYNWIKQEVCKQSSNPPSDLCNGSSGSNDDEVGQVESQNNDDGFSDQGGSSGGSYCHDMNKFQCKRDSNCYFNKFDKSCSPANGGNSGENRPDSTVGSSGGGSSGGLCSSLSKFECKRTNGCYFNKMDKSCSDNKQSFGGGGGSRPDKPDDGFMPSNHGGGTKADKPNDYPGQFFKRDNKGKKWVTVVQDDFSSGFGFFNNVEGTGAKWVSSKDDRTGLTHLQAGSSVYTDSIEIVYSVFRVDLSFYMQGTKNNDSFCFDRSTDGGSEWTETCWSTPVDLSNDMWYDDVSIMFEADGSSDLMVRLRCVGDDTKYGVYIDKITIQGSTS